VAHHVGMPGLDARRLDGIVPIISMPFDADGAVNADGLRCELDFLVGLDVPAFGFGFGSEVISLTDRERDDAVRLAAAHIAGRRPLLAGVSGGSVRAVIARAEATAEAGADILMVNAPPGSAPADVTAVMRGAAATGRAVVVQDAPSMSGVELSVDQLVALVDDVDGIVALKLESIPSAPKVGAVARRIHGRVSVLGGAGGGDFYHELRRGADGTVPGAGFPEVFIDVWQAFRAGRVDDARKAFGRALPLIHLSLRSGETFLWIQKECLRRRGILRTADLRAPSAPVDPELSAELDDALGDLGVAWARGGAA
jgi:dihydrodipicolinate synthase/N-acetylneuraminate lyase